MTIEQRSQVCDNLQEMMKMKQSARMRNICLNQHDNLMSRLPNEKMLHAV